jgi:glucose/arabinose dehydrogenase
MLERRHAAAALACLLFLVACVDIGRDIGLDPDPEPTAELAAPRAFPSLAFDDPVGMLQAPGDDTRWFVVEQDGVVRVFENDENVADDAVFIDVIARVASPLDSAGGETGLLGMAFHPDFPADPRAYLSYTALEGGELVSRLSEFSTTDDGETLDPDSELVLLSVGQPEANHNGGHIQFGPDGFLYIGLGDGGGSGDDHGEIGNGQSLRTLLGKMLRIDVNGTVEPGFEYAIPPDNPFSGNAPCGDGGLGDEDCPEIYAYGFRNPWRWSFDGSTGDLWVGDVGQNSWEEIDNVVLGGNYGWRCREASHSFDSDCGDADELLDPLYEYGREAGFSVTGGHVYRGSAIEELAGRYVFGDLGGRIWRVATDVEPTEELEPEDGFDSGLEIVSFAEDAEGELYIVDHGGTLHRLEEAEGD